MLPSRYPCTVTVRAIDGYAPEFKLSDIDSSKFILAIKANGKFLGMGGRGPVWLVFSPHTYQGQPEDDGGLTWAVIHIEVWQASQRFLKKCRLMSS